MLLINSGANVKATVGRKRTFLHKACGSSDADFVKSLLKATLAQHGQEEANQLLHSEDMDGDTPLMIAVKRKSSDITKVLLDMGVEVDHHNNGMEYSMHKAAANGSLEIVKFLHFVSIRVYYLRYWRDELSLSCIFREERT